MVSETTVSIRDYGVLRCECEDTSMIIDEAQASIASLVAPVQNLKRALDICIKGNIAISIFSLLSSHSK